MAAARAAGAAARRGAAGPAAAGGDDIGSAFLRLASKLSNLLKQRQQVPSGTQQVVLAAAEELKRLEGPLAAGLGAFSAARAAGVLEAWSRAHTYVPPADLLAAVAGRLQQLLKEPPAAGEASQRPLDPAAAALEQALASVGRSSETLMPPMAAAAAAAAAGQPGSSRGTSASEAAPRDAGEPAVGGGTPVSWKQVFVPLRSARVAESGESTTSSSSVADRGTSSTISSSAAAVSRPFGPEAYRNLAAVCKSFMSLAYIADNIPAYRKDVVAWALEVGPTAVELVRDGLAAAVQGGEQGSGSSSPARESTSQQRNRSSRGWISSSNSSSSSSSVNSGGASGPPSTDWVVKHGVELLWGACHVGHCNEMQDSLQRPLLELLTPHVPDLPVPLLLRFLVALAELEAGARRRATESVQEATGPIPVGDLPAGPDGAPALEDGWRPPGGRRAAAAARRMGSAYDTTGTAIAPVPLALRKDVRRAAREGLSAAAKRLEELAPSLDPYAAASAAGALAHLCGSHHKFGGDEEAGAVAFTVRPLGAMAAALAALPPDERLPLRLAPQLAAPYARLLYADAALFSRIASDALAEGLDGLASSELAALVWAFACTNVRHDGLLAAASASAARRLDAFSPLQVANLLWGCTALGHDNPALLAAATNVVAGMVGRWLASPGNIPWGIATQLLQVHNLHRLLADPGLGGHGGPPLFALPRTALPALRRTVARHRAPFKVSGFHADVLGVLRRDMGLELRKEVGLLDGGLSIDVLVLYKGEAVAVETDGPWHYTRSFPRRRNGKSALRNRLLSAAGYVTVAIPVHVWQRLRGTERAAFLDRALSAAAAEQRALRARRQAAAVAALGGGGGLTSSGAVPPDHGAVDIDGSVIL